ncbi:hypothetical protein [Zooshikella harenae]|uniref:Helix-turn-helix domain-containing protein n=1 Tax=Zooshikella harenae TaxID=2827238 RepID=A0ABS5ZB75_9GAMM|nr:hypothetical protein [Zooshikella harenae]MBU2711235.1 hypothetical protein [Zooshikella harenae]
MMKPQELILISDWGEARRQQTLKMIREGYNIHQKVTTWLLHQHSDGR